MKTGTKIAIGIGGLVLVGGLIWLLTQNKKKDDEIAEVNDDDVIEGQPDRKDDENPPVLSEYGGNVIFDSGVEGASIDDLVKNNREPQPVEKDWSQDPYYYI